MTEPKEYQQLSSNMFSGKFPLPINFPNPDKVRDLIVHCDVIRKPLSDYYSVKTNPNESFYGTMVLCRDGYVQERKDIKYEMQTYSFGDRNASNLFHLIQCTFDALAIGLVAISDATGAGAFQVQDPSFFQPIQSFPDIIKFVCHADTLIRVVVSYVEYDTCNDNQTKNKKPKKPDPPDAKFPPGSPVGKADGYSPKPPNTNAGDYQPFPTDNDGDQGGTTGDSCQPVTVVTSYEISSDGGAHWSTISAPINVFAKVGEINIGTNPSGNADVLLECQGIADFGEECGDFQPRGITGFNSSEITFRNPQIISIT